MVRIGDIENTFITIFTKYCNGNAPKAIKLMLKWGVEMQNSYLMSRIVMNGYKSIDIIPSKAMIIH